MAKLSKRELAVKKAKSTKVSTPTRQIASKSVAPLVGSGPLLPGQARVGSVVTGAGPLLQGQTRAVDSSSSSSKSKSSSNTSKPSSPKSLSPTVENAKSLSTPKSTDSISATPKATVSSSLNRLMASIGQMWGNNGFNQASPNAFFSDKQRQDNLNSGLGISTASASVDQPTGYGPNGETYYNNFDPAVDGPTLLRSDFATPGTDFTRPGSEEAYLRGVSPIDYGTQSIEKQISFGASPVNPVTGASVQNRVTTTNSPTLSSTLSRTPRSVASPYTAPAQTSFTPNIPQASFAPDMTPANTGQPGTRRQFIGNGILSNGLASNGKLDSGFDGASFGTNQLDEESFINQILGIKTTQASEMPQTMESFSQPNFSQQSFSPYASNLGDTAETSQARFNSLYGESQNEQDKTTPQPRVKDPAEQFAQGATGGSPMEGYYAQAQKGVTAQEKAQKKALNELLKSIKNQYKTQQESGLSELAKSKQQDLLKLSGLFSFANQDPNSEQRMQYEQRANQGFADTQSDFLAKLAAAQSQEESGARQNYQKELGSLADKRSNMQLELAKLLEDARQSQLARSSKVSTPKTGSFTQVGVNPQTGAPVYRNFTTGEQWEGNGLQAKYDPFAAFMGQQQGQGQVQYDENGRPYIEQ